MDIVSKMIEFIEINIQEDLTYKTLENKFGYSERHLRRIFKQRIGMPIFQYVTQRRMVRSFVDIKLNILSLESISIKYRYDTYDSFIRAFKRVFKTTPRKSSNFDVKVEFIKLTKEVTIPIIVDDNILLFNNFENVKSNNESLINRSKPLIISIDGAGKRVIESYNGNKDQIIELKNDQVVNPVYINSIQNKYIDNNLNPNVCFIFGRDYNKKSVKELRQRFNNKGIVIIEYYLDNNYDDKKINSNLLHIIKLLNYRHFELEFYEDLLNANINGFQIEYFNTDNIEDLNIVKNANNSFILIKSKYETSGDEIFSFFSTKKAYIDSQIIVDERIDGLYNFSTFKLVKLL